MIRTGKWKYCYYHKDREQLFDLNADPAEAVNLIARPERRELAAELKRRALASWKLEPPKRGRKG
jgi:arylsulfatase A-like enzyme